MFTSLTVIPNIVAMLDENYDISVILDSSEEEEKNAEQKGKDFETEILTERLLEDYIFCLMTVQLPNDKFTTYSSLYKELISPPPEVRD